jgi:hypothetical protein
VRDEAHAGLEAIMAREKANVSCPFAPSDRIRLSG